MRQIVLAVAVLLSSMVHAQMMPIEHDALRLPAPGTLAERVTSLEGSPVSMPSDGLTSMSSATAGCTVPIACNYDPSATSDDGSCVDDCLSASPYYLEDYQTHCSNPAACNYNADVEYAIEAFCVFDVQHYADEAGVPSSGTDAFLVASLPPFSPASVTPGDPSFNGASAATLQEILDNDVTPFLAAGGQVVWVAAEPDGWLLPSYGVEDPGGYHDEYQLPWEDLLPGQIVYDDLWLFHTINLTGIVWNVTAGCSSVCLAEMVGASFTPEIDYFDILTLPPDEAVGVVLDCCEGENCPDFACLDPEACNYSLSGGLADNTLCTYDEECGCMDAGACNYDPSASIEGWCDYACTGCTDPSACEYDPSAILDNGSCTYSETCGCMDTEACNFSPDATEPAWCDFNSCTGCMDSAACNFNPEATIDMGCDLPIWAMMQSWMTWDGVSFSALEAEFEDKVILLEFGGTWCYPCLLSREEGVAAELLAAVGPQGSDEARLVHILDPNDFDFEIFQEFYLGNQVDGEFFVISTAAWEDMSETFAFPGLPAVHSACPDQCASNVGVASVVGVSPFQVDDILDGVEAGCVPSCMDVEACNYALGGTYDAGCNYDVACGCMDPAACNFDEVHTEAGWCDYTSCGTCTNPFADNYDPEATHSNEEVCQFEGYGSYQYSCADPDACNGLSEWFEEQYANNAYCTYTLGEHLEQLGVTGIDDGPWLVSVFPPYTPAMVDSTSASFVPDLASDYYDVMDHRIAPFLENGGQVLWLGAEPDGWLMSFNDVPSPSEYHAQAQLPWEAILPGTIVYDDVLRQLLMRETGMAFGTWMAVAGCPSTCWLELQQSLVLEPWDEPTEGVLQMSPYALLNTIPTCCTGPDCPPLVCIDPMACNFDPEGQFGSLQACEYSSGGAPCGCMDEAACNFNVNAVEPAWCDYSCIGCTNPAACNYDPDATQDDGNCLVNALCGCQDEGACNYNALAIVEGWCDYSSCAGCMNPMACDFDPEATVPGACDEAVNDAISEWVLHDGTTMADHIDDLNGKRLLFEMGGTWCPPCLASREVGLASAWMAEFGPLGTDEVRLIHLLDMSNFDDDTFEEYWLDYAVPGEYFVLDQEGYSAMNEWYGVGGGIPILYSACGTQCVSTLPDASVVGVFPGTELGPAELGAMLFSDECPPAGCMDETACNFLPEAVIEDGSCLYEANCGCADPFSCNYDIEATSEGWCDYTSCAGCIFRRPILTPQRPSMMDLSGWPRGLDVVLDALEWQFGRRPDR